MRLHARLGARVATPLPRSMHTTGSVADSEPWLDLPLPESGEYVFDRARGFERRSRGRPRRYWEPNGWTVHSDVR